MPSRKGEEEPPWSTRNAVTTLQIFDDASVGDTHTTKCQNLPPRTSNRTWKYTGTAKISTEAWIHTVPLLTTTVLAVSTYLSVCLFGSLEFTSRLKRSAKKKTKTTMATEESHQPPVAATPDEKKEPMLRTTELDEDPLLIAQTLTYVTDDGSTVMSFRSAPYSFGM